jgi:hypothetical protein
VVGISLLNAFLKALGIMLLLVLSFWETIFLDEGYLLFVFFSFGSFLVDCCMVHTVEDGA